MTEIPDHLLERTRSRRQALGLPVSGGGGGEAGATPAAPAAAGGGGGAVAATNLPKGPVAPSGPAATPAVPERPLPPYVQAAQRRRRIPVWAMPVVAILPLWAFLYAGTLEPPKKTTLTLAEEGAVEYTGAAACAGCHGASGAGGVGPQLSDGTVVATFANPVDQVRWVALGSAKGGDVYTAVGKAVKGGMPTFADTLTLEQIVGVVLHERKDLSGHPVEDDAELWAELRQLPEDEELAEYGYTEEQVETILEEIATQEGVEIPEAEEG